jgi:hypothetical protein
MSIAQTKRFRLVRRCSPVSVREITTAAAQASSAVIR